VTVREQAKILDFGLEKVEAMSRVACPCNRHGNNSWPKELLHE
jgi:hypothetical protein